MMQGYPIKEIIDLYSKFLIAFVSIVTPALALYLNNYLINKTAFDKVILTEEDKAQKLRETENAIIEEGNELIAISNERLTAIINQLDLWKEVRRRLNPKDFFISNVILLSLSMFFLFIWLFVRTEKFIPRDCECFQLFQVSVCFLSVGFCSWHLIKLVRMGIYLIDIKPTVDIINNYIKKEREYEKPEQEK